MNDVENIVAEASIYDVDIRSYDFFRDNEKTIDFLQNDEIGEILGKLVQKAHPNQENMHPEEIAGFINSLHSYQVSGRADYHPTMSLERDDNGNISYEPIIYANVGSAPHQEYADVEIAEEVVVEVPEGLVVVETDEDSIAALYSEPGARADYLAEEGHKAEIRLAIDEYANDTGDVYHDKDLLASGILLAYEQLNDPVHGCSVPIGDSVFQGPVSETQFFEVKQLMLEMIDAGNKNLIEISKLGREVPQASEEKDLTSEFSDTSGVGDVASALAEFGSVSELDPSAPKPDTIKPESFF